MDLQVGFEWHAVITVDPEQPPGADRKVIFEAGARVGGPRFTVALDRGNGLSLEVTDSVGHVFKSEPVVPIVQIATPVHLGCVVGPSSDGRSELAVFVNNQLRARGAAVGHWPPAAEESVPMSLGTDVNGKNPAAFTIAEVLAYGKVLSDSERADIHAYLKNKYALAS